MNEGVLKKHDCLTVLDLSSLYCRHGIVDRQLQNLEVFDILPEENIVLIRGNVPGGKNGYVLIQNAVKKVTYKIEMKRVINRRLVMGIGDGVLEADGTPIYWAADLRVGLSQRP